MAHNLIFVALSLLFSSCIFNQITYPYAENNTTEQCFFNSTIKDDYKWLELETPSNTKRIDWLNAQHLLSEKKLNHNKEIYERIEELGDIRHTLHAGIIENDVYYLKMNLYKNDADLFCYKKKDNKCIKLKSFNFPFHLKSTTRIRISPNGQRLSIITERHDQKFDLFIYNLKSESQNPERIIPYVKDYNTKWTTNSKELIFIKDGINDMKDSINSYYVCSALINNNSIKISKYITSDTHKLFNSIGYSYDENENKLYIAERSVNKKDLINIFCINRENSSSMVLWHKLKACINSIYEIAGLDSNNIYIFKYDKQIRGSLLSLNKNTRTLHTFIKERNVPFSGFSIVKDHFLIGYKNDLKHEAYIINRKTYKKKAIGVSQNGRYRFFDNPNDTVIYYNHESHFEPIALYSSTINNPQTHVRLCQFGDIPYNVEDFITEYAKIQSSDGDGISISISYRKGLKRDGNNPAILLSYLNGIDELKNSFYFARILFMEQGFVFIQRNDVENINSIPLTERCEDIKLIRDYLINNKYTKKERLCLSGREYGSTAIAVVLNQEPDFCKTAILTDGIYDLVNFNHIDKLMLSVDNKVEFDKTLKISPYHQIKYKESYPSMLNITTQNNDEIRCFQTHKYVAKMQMRTKGKNPILLFQPEKREITASYEVSDYYDCIYHAISFLSKELRIKVSKSNFSRPLS